MTDPSLDWPSRLRAALAADDSPCLLLVAPGVSMGPDTLTALLDALRDRPGLGAVSPVGLEDLRASWGLPTAVDVAAEAWTWCPHEAVDAAPDPRCALWRREAAKLAAVGAMPPAAFLPHRPLALGGAGRFDPRLAAWRPHDLAASRRATTAAGRGRRPVVLHVLHDWGGGVAHFVREQMRCEADADSLALVSRGGGPGGFGQSLALYADLDALPIRQWTLAPAASDLTLRHPDLARVLREVSECFGVSLVRVSSLIGSSLDVLATGLPTQYVVHDLFPFWPLIDDGEALPGWDAARLAAAAAAPGWRFATRDPARWRDYAEATLTALVTHAVTLVAPSRFALERLGRVAPALPLGRAPVIPHGCALVGPARPPRRPGPLRVLVPGRLEGGKGERLLDALLPRLPSGTDWQFVGGDAAAQRYATRMGGRAVATYALDELPALVAAFDPDIALLPSLVPETFGFVLSEMQALGVPVLAADQGAYGERLLATPGAGWAVPASADAFAAALARFAADPGALPRQVPDPPRWPQAMTTWRALGVGEARPGRLPSRAVAIEQHATGILRIEAEALRAERDRAYRFHERDTADLIGQRDVAVAQNESMMDEARRQGEKIHELELARQAAISETERVAREHRERELWLHAREQRLQVQERTACEQRDAAYGLYERDTADLIRQRDVALSQRDAFRHELDELRALLAHPLLRVTAGGVRRVRDLRLSLRYHLQRQVGLFRRGLHSLRQRGPRATWAALCRHFGRSGVAKAEPAAAASQPLAFAPSAAPRTSVVIPVYGKLEYTLACLHSLAASGMPEDTEVIVIDDASPDDTERTLRAVPGLRYQRQKANLGFVDSCNAGAELARGEFLVLLNNDTTVTRGWLQALLATFEHHPDTGLAGALLVYPDGRLQESGGIVFADGSGWNYGRFEDPRHPSFTHVREVDYCSGAAIALRRSLFLSLGGFDARYAPAYYEDTDLAMKVREAGLKVRVQPAAVVVHHEGVTAGTDTASGTKAYQLRNQHRFVERWHDTLLRRHPRPGQTPQYAASHRARARVLVIDATTPMPDRDSGSVRLFALLRLLVEEGCAVTFFPENGLDDGRYTQALRDIGIETWTQPWLGALPDWLTRHGPSFQLIVVSRHYVLSPLLPLLRRFAPQARIVFDTVDVHHLREQREAERNGDSALARSAQRTREQEMALIREVDRTWVVSPFEKALLATEAPGAVVDVVSNIHRPRGPGPARRAREGLLFVGGFRHPPNVDAALWLVDAILPRIRALRPEITLSLVGGDVPPEIQALGEREGVTVHGHVADLEPLLDAHRVSLAPLRYGAGVKGKVNTALAHGLPVVATRCAVEGMGLVDGHDVLVGDDADALATAVLRLYDDEALWNTLVAGGLANTAREFSPERARDTLRTVLAQIR